MKWYDNTAEHADIVLSTRVRLARNLKEYPFPARLNEKGKEEAVAHLNELSDIIQQQTNVENLIIAKGFDDCAVFIQNGECSVVVTGKELKSDSLLAIKDIVISQTGISFDKNGKERIEDVVVERQRDARDLSDRRQQLAGHSHLHLFWFDVFFIHLLEQFGDVLHVGTATSEYDTREEIVGKSRLTDLGEDIGHDLAGACLYDFLKVNDFDVASIGSSIVFLLAFSFGSIVIGISVAIFHFDALSLSFFYLLDRHDILGDGSHSKRYDHQVPFCLVLVNDDRSGLCPKIHHSAA